MLTSLDKLAQTIIRPYDINNTVLLDAYFSNFEKFTFLYCVHSHHT